jgi:hypothetical protein
MEVYVYFNPTPGSERVIGVTIWRSFGSPTPVRAVIDSAREKYTIEPTSSGTSQQAFLAWRFDGRDRPMSEAAASRAGLLGSRAMGTSLPKTVNNTDGVGLDVDVVRDPHNQELAQSYSVSLYRGSDLFSFAPQAQAAYSAAEKARKEQELDKAKDSGTKIKM